MIGSIKLRLARPLRARARAAKERGDWRGALAAYQQTVGILGARPNLLIQIGNMQTELADYEQARESFHAAAEDRAFTLSGQLGLAGVCERAEDWPGAVQAWERVLQTMALEEGTPLSSDWTISPALALLHSAKCRELSGDGSGAERDFALALILDPRSRLDREAALMRARLLAKASSAAAFRFLKRSHRRFPDDIAIMLTLVQSALSLGQRDEAALTAARMLAASPGHPVLTKLITDSRLELASEDFTSLKRIC